MASSDGKRPPITGLDNLMRILTRIKCKNQDYLDPDSMDVWNDAQQTYYDTFSKYPEPLCSILGSLVDSKLCMKAVNRVQMLLRKRIDLLQKSSNPLLLEHGIKAMPNELLAKVFEIGHYAMEGCEFSLRVSHVSHRFRQIAIRTPLLWSRISGLYPASQIKVFLSRAGQLGLRIQVCPPSNEKAAGASLESFLGDMRTYSNQWDCKIAETVRVQAPDGLFFASEGEPEDWECYSSLRTLQFIGCRELYESELKEFADHLISPEDGRGLLSLEVYSCRGISNDFLEDLEETVGKKLRWTAR
ncbi:hypothetical protein BD410DRAFT_476926 [Rickenella mellea]|uniref:Uncharacterized protein n=1 Tax=Rickenella mellea TaxID=50990 RepID=A0A4Y7QI88_9AGAM|nr:hypothetical protein BD410DRAFT_476926 [Rickenella mellea]